MRPLRYQATLTNDPARTSFDGEIAIDVALDAPAAVIWAHSEELAIAEAWAEQGGGAIGLTPWSAAADVVALRATAAGCR